MTRSEDPTMPSDPPPAAGLLSVAEARARLVAAVAPLAEIELVPLERAVGRVLAAPLVAARSVPSADNSAMDGFALRVADLEAAGGALPIAGRAAAGERPTVLAPGTAMSIFTGAVVPAGADAVVPIEDVAVEGGAIRPTKVVALGANVRRAGEDLAVGDEVLPAGRRLRPQDLAAAASVGVARLEVRRALRVAVVATGDELVAPGEALEPGQLHDGNGPMLAAVFASLGAEVTGVARVRDDLDATVAALRAAADGADLIVTSGGVSVGEEDHVKAAVRALGRIEVWKVAVQPGKPIGFGRVGGVPWLGLPGNPVSSLVTLLVFGVPLLRRLQGREPLLPAGVPVPAGFARPHPNRREEYVRVALRDGRLVPYPQQGSGVLRSTVWADGLARIPAGALVADGDPLDYFSFDELLG
jgi:molybdopterin molybdotransferase